VLAPLIFLETIEDVKIGGVAIPRQTALMMLTLHGGLQETHFADADQFRPERWLEQAQASRCATIQGRSFPLGRVRVSAQGANWLCWKSRRSWLCCAPNFVAGLFFGLNLVEDHPNVKDRMGRERAGVSASIRSVCYAFILYKLEHHPAWTNPPHIVPQVSSHLIQKSTSEKEGGT
jgi:hypothetical protein